MTCAAKGCQNPVSTLTAHEYPSGEEWRFCIRHFWYGVHALLNRGAERVIVRYPNGAKREKMMAAPWLGRPETTP